MTAPVLVTGASGFVGSHLCQALVDQGHDVRAMTRHPDSYDGAGTPVAGDVSDPASLEEPFAGVKAAYYLVHALDSADFVKKDAEAATAFGKAAAHAGVEQIVYLGGLGSERDDLSDHLKSRREVEHLLAEGGVPVTTLRAAIVIGHGGISWEMTRELVAHLPAMVAPRWVNTKTQPIALTDVIRYLVGVLGRPEAYGRVFEVGGADVLTYGEMLQRVAKMRHGRPLPILVVPVLTPGLSSRWLSLVTSVDVETGRNLIDSMSNEVVVSDRSITEIVPGPVLGYEDAVRAALAERARAEAAAAGADADEAEAVRSAADEADPAEQDA